MRGDVPPERRCTATNNRGEPCRRSAIVGGFVCANHGGNAPQARAAAARRLKEAEVRAEAAMLGIPADVDPGPALLEMVSEAAGNVGFYRSLIAELGTDVTTSESVGQNGSREVPNVVVRMYDAERDRLAQCAALALKAGVEERAVRLAEADARELVSAVEKSITAAGLSSEQTAAFRAALAEQLRTLGGTPVPVESASRTNPPNVANEPPSLS